MSVLRNSSVCDKKSEIDLTKIGLDNTVHNLSCYPDATISMESNVIALDGCLKLSPIYTVESASNDFYPKPYFSFRSKDRRGNNSVLVQEQTEISKFVCPQLYEMFDQAKLSINNYNCAQLKNINYSVSNAVSLPLYTKLPSKDQEILETLIKPKLPVQEDLPSSCAMTNQSNLSHIMKNSILKVPNKTAEEFELFEDFATMVENLGIVCDYQENRTVKESIDELYDKFNNMKSNKSIISREDNDFQSL